jgi:hypothetical protein
MSDTDDQSLARIYPEFAADLAQYVKTLIAEGRSPGEATSIARDVCNELLAFYDALEPARKEAMQLRAIRDCHLP